MPRITLDANEAVARIAYKLNEVIAIYPITPASSMGEWADAWAAEHQTNLWGVVPTVIEMQSEAGAAGAVHGALQAGSLTTTFTASQGLLLMLPNLYKIAGELTPAVIHIAARSLAAQGLSIFGDHSDVMAARATGFALLASNSVQEAQDFALISQAATLAARVPFLHFFDGFRTSHEINTIELLEDEIMHAMIDLSLVDAIREHALTPDHPVIRGTAQNPDVYFQARESANPFYLAVPNFVQAAMDKFASLTGRQYQLYEYVGAPDAERVIVIMGSGAETAEQTALALNENGAKVGVLKVRLYRPFDKERFFQMLPVTTRAIAVLDRTKEPGSTGEPLYLDVVDAVYEGLVNGWSELNEMPKIVGGRYGLSSKEFTPGMVKAIYNNLRANPSKNHFTVGIFDDVTHTSLEYDTHYQVEPRGVVRAVFYGLGSDGTVGANKNSIKIIGENTENFAQGYFVYDSKKSGAMTVSHLRFGPTPIPAPYLISEADFVAVHQPQFLEQFDTLELIKHGGTLLLNTTYEPHEIWERLPRSMQQTLIDKQIAFYVINAYRVARENGMGGRINTVMQTCFFAISNVLPPDEAIEQIKYSIRKTYGKKGDAVVAKNIEAVDNSLAHLHRVEIPSAVSSTHELREPVPAHAPEFVRDVLGKMIAKQGDLLPVSALPVDGTYPSGTAQYEKRNLALEIPVWNPDLCIQCGKCTMVCPHAAIRIKAYEASIISDAPEAFKYTASKERDWAGLDYTIQVAPEDCTGCTLCVDVCPARDRNDKSQKALMMADIEPLREQEKLNWDYFLQIPDLDRSRIKNSSIRQQQLQQPLFEFSGACSGCGETPYVKLLTQLFGDHTLIANATGCSSIFGGNLPTTPYTYNEQGRGPAWANSLFEDNAEFGLGMRVSVDKLQETAQMLLKALASEVGQELVDALLSAPQTDDAELYEQRERVIILRERLQNIPRPEAQRLHKLADYLVKKSVWILGGDGWAYDIGYGGLDHVLASGMNVNILVLDTEVYSNTGGQMSKSTPRAAVAKFAAGGKAARKKDLGLMAMTYGNVYVASIAMGAKDEQTLRALLEAASYEGPSLVIAYSHCIAHGIRMGDGLHEHQAMVDSGEWLLYRYDPRRSERGENPLKLDSRAPKLPLIEFMQMENRFKMLMQSDPEAAHQLAEAAQRDVNERYAYYEYLASRPAAVIGTGD